MGMLLLEEPPFPPYTLRASPGPPGAAPPPSGHPPLVLTHVELVPGLLADSGRRGGLAGCLATLRCTGNLQTQGEARGAGTGRRPPGPIEAGFRETELTCDLLQRLKYSELLRLYGGSVGGSVPRRRIRRGPRRGWVRPPSTSWPCHPPQPPLHLNPLPIEPGCSHPELQSPGPGLANIKTIFISFDLEILLLGMWPRETLAPVPKGMCKGELFVRGKI